MKARIYIPNVGESEAEIPGGTPYQADDVQKYELGTIMRLGGRTFIYALASGTQIPDVGSQCQHQWILNCSVQANAAAGAKTVSISRAATSGPANDGVIAADSMKGGYIVIFPAATNKAIVRQIMGNTATIAGSTRTITFTLDSPLPCAITTSDTAEAMCSPYYKVITAASTVKSVVGIPTVPATDGQYFWLQTWGPCWCATSAQVGDAENDRRVVFRYNGSLDEEAYGGTYNSSKAQHAGFVLANAYAGTQGAPFFMLQITP